MPNLLGLGGNHMMPLPQMMMAGMAATDAGEHIAPTKLSAEDLPPGLRQLHLVNVGFKSSKVPLPCVKLQHLQIERCKAARALGFRILPGEPVANQQAGRQAGRHTTLQLL